MMITEEDTNVDGYDELLQFIENVNESVRRFSFQNDHVVRGPLCRIVGLVSLLQRENFEPGVRELINMLQKEVQRIEDVTMRISRDLNTHEDLIQRMIDELKNKND